MEIARFVSGHVGSPELPYEWDEWSIKKYYMFTEAALFERLDVLTNSANAALTCAAGEWICARFAALEPDPQPLQFLEAAWAGIVHPAYCIYTETVDDEWRGPIRAPLAVTIAIANDALFCLSDDPHGATRVCWMSNLAHHVLPACEAFDEWLEATIRRFERHHLKSQEPRGAEDLFSEIPWGGRPVPRAAADPAFPYDPESAPLLLDEYLRQLDPAVNPFLRPATDLADVRDLPGPPYRYLAGR